VAHAVHFELWPSHHSWRLRCPHLACLPVYQVSLFTNLQVCMEAAKYGLVKELLMPPLLLLLLVVLLLG
jgi:hypothetical protein